jgi:hypothetical protein
MKPLVIFLWPSFIDRCAIHGGCFLAWWWWNVFIGLTKRSWRSSSWIVRLEYWSSSSPFYSNITLYTSSILVKPNFSIVVCWVSIHLPQFHFWKYTIKVWTSDGKLCYCLCGQDSKNEGQSDQLNDVVDVFHTFFGVTNTTTLDCRINTCLVNRPIVRINEHVAWWLEYMARKRLPSNRPQRSSKHVRMTYNTWNYKNTLKVVGLSTSSEYMICKYVNYWIHISSCKYITNLCLNIWNKFPSPKHYVLVLNFMVDF